MEQKVYNMLKFLRDNTDYPELLWECVNRVVRDLPFVVANGCK